MPHHHAYTYNDLPKTLAVFPLSGALLLPRLELPLNVFEPRYLAMIDDALKSHRLIGIIQPLAEEKEGAAPPALAKIGCAGRISAFQETGDGRYLISLAGLIRYEMVEELAVETPYRQISVSYDAFQDDLVQGREEEAVDRHKLLATFKQYLDAHQMETDWQSVHEAPSEALVNALSMMAPYGPREKQALLEAHTLQDRAEMLIAMTELTIAQKYRNVSELLN